MNHRETQIIAHSTRMKNLWIALISAVVIGVLIGFFMAGLEFKLSQVIVYASLGGGGTGALIYRERMLVSRCIAVEQKYIERVGGHNARLEHLYMKSLASLVEFDASTLIIQRASIGFYDLLGFGPEVQLHGEQLEEVLGLERGGLKALIDHISHGSTSLRQAIKCKRVDGQAVGLLVSAYYIEDSNYVEAAFFRTHVMNDPKTNVDEMAEELGRIRRGMIGREERVLALKSEVNELLKELDQPARYQVDKRSDDTRISFKLGHDTQKGSLSL
ncbi:MAG: hypothetical protein ACSHX8_04225 [Opitutaceae bacterium]